MTRILVVDDNERNRYMAEVLLSKNGYQVEMAANGAEALEKARHMPPDLVLADILMPVMDGYSLCREWKQDARLMSIPFVVYTATYTDPEDEKFALALGAARFIEKPIDPEGLLVIIQEVLDQFQSGQLRPCAGTLPEEDVYLRQYNQILIHKLEDKLIQLETAKQTLEDEIKLRKQIEGHLVQAQKMEAIGTLAGGIAHDFNNILSAVIGYTELALDDVENGSLAQNNLQEVLKAGRRAKELVLQILTFSRQHEQEQKPINIMHIVKEALKLMRASLPAIIEIRDDMKSNSPVNADPTQIHQVLMNLCTNAGHAMQEKGGTLKVELSDTELDSDFAGRHPDLKPGSYVKLSVSDTGCGMPADVLKRIFDPFFTTKSSDEGTGMGLSVVHGIVKNHGGTITVYSDPGQGTTFNIFLPVIETEPGPETTAQQRIPTGTERILFIDDEPVLTKLASRLLGSLGYEVTTRTSGLEALELFRAHPDRFDLVITDMTMPDMTGDKMTQELMRIRADIPIILCTGFSARIDEKKAKAMGIRAFVLKPIVKSDLARKIRMALDQPEERNF